jgi:2-amino-4-hydroxy-6-hydroxymethyldihydropteridine diphosphokinase
MNKACLLLGSNEGNREGWLQQAVALLTGAGPVIAQSAIYTTAAWGKEDQPDFLNMALCIDTALTSLELLHLVQDIELKLGRQRDVKWGQRTLDIDIITYNSEVIDLPDLKVPHPFMQERRFVLVPMNDIVPGWQHPILNKTVAQLLDECPDTLEVNIYKA